ncbi:MAG: hypothetical protein J2P48_13560, partial [Alphaproteobacteria bacterium]|nr:hypothetical protein [Alphaproteobacteria bacterium]
MREHDHFLLGLEDLLNVLDDLRDLRHGQPVPGFRHLGERDPPRGMHFLDRIAEGFLVAFGFRVVDRLQG